MLTPSQRNEIIIMREAGHSIASIADKTGVGSTAIKSVFREHKISKGAATAALIDESRKRLVSDHNFSETLKATIAGLVSDDLAIIRRLRENILSTLELIESDDSLSPVMRGRSLAALSTSLSLTQQTYRKSLQLSKHEGTINSDELPILTMHHLTASQEESIRKVADDTGGYDLPEVTIDDETDHDVVEET